MMQRRNFNAIMHTETRESYLFADVGNDAYAPIIFRLWPHSCAENYQVPNPETTADNLEGILGMAVVLIGGARLNSTPPSPRGAHLLLSERYDLFSE